MPQTEARPETEAASPALTSEGAGRQDDVYATFVGPIDQSAAHRLANSVAIACSGGVKRLHVLFQSEGGEVGAGVFLYSLFRSLPFDLTLYNSGSVQSAATIAYLGAKHRKASTHAAFMIHRSFAIEHTATAARLKSVAESVRVDDERTEAILRSHITLTPERWSDLDRHDLTFTAREAVAIGLADEVCDFSPPPGSQFFNL